MYICLCWPTLWVIFFVLQDFLVWGTVLRPLLLFADILYFHTYKCEECTSLIVLRKLFSSMWYPDVFLYEGVALSTYLFWVLPLLGLPSKSTPVLPLSSAGYPSHQVEVYCLSTVNTSSHNLRWKQDRCIGKLCDTVYVIPLNISLHSRHCFTMTLSETCGPSYRNQHCLVT